MLLLLLQRSPQGLLLRNRVLLVVLAWLLLRTQIRSRVWLPNPMTMMAQECLLALVMTIATSKACSAVMMPMMPAMLRVRNQIVLLLLRLHQQVQVQVVRLQLPQHLFPPSRPPRRSPAPRRLPPPRPVDQAPLLQQVVRQQSASRRFRAEAPHLVALPHVPYGPPPALPKTPRAQRQLVVVVPLVWHIHRQHLEGMRRRSVPRPLLANRSHTPPRVSLRRVPSPHRGGLVGLGAPHREREQPLRLP